MGEKERILSSRRYKLDHEPFDWAKEYLELMEGAWDEARDSDVPREKKDDKVVDETN